MHILSCENPRRIWNKYLGEFVWTRCNECASCRNTRAAKWTCAIERERLSHRFSFFVTLTYDNEHLPVLTTGSFSDDYSLKDPDVLYASKDDFELSYRDLLDNYCGDYKDISLVNSYLAWIGIPYASSVDLQKFHKRLNKYIHDNYTQKYQNFRFFVCSEYGSTTFRPHFHGIYFVDDPVVAEHFAECIFLKWKQGRIDCQYVEKSAGSYVAQYVNKSVGLPQFYLKGEIRQRFYFSRFPTIGSMQQSDEEVQKVFDSLSVQRVDRKSSTSTQIIMRPNDPSFENRFFPKCFQFKSLPDTCRIKLYTIVSRFPAQGWREFCHFIKSYYLECQRLFQYSLPCYYSEFSYNETSTYWSLICEKVGDFTCLTAEAETWLRRVYYTSKRFLNNCKRFNISVFDYYQRIKEYWSKKELYILKEFYSWQENYVNDTKDSDSLVMCYPEFCYNNFGPDWIDKVNRNTNSPDLRIMIDDAKYYFINNHLTHFKNAYLDLMSLSDNKPIYKQIKNFVYAKKCNEINQAIAPSW